jgi:hypothetical protein
MVKSVVGLIFSLFFSIKLSIIEGISIGFSIYVILDFYYKIGKQFCFIEFIKAFTVITCLIAPSLFYHYFLEFDDLSKYFEEMSVSSSRYYFFTFPAVLFFFIGLDFHSNSTFPLNYKSRLNEFLHDKGHYSIYLVAIGIFSSIASNYVISSLIYIFQIFHYLIYVGLLYAVLSKYKFKSLIILVVISYIFIQIILSGMYTELFQFGIIISIILVTIYRISKFKKIILVLTAIIVLIFIQVIKTEYRILTWDGSSKEGSVSVYYDVILDRLKSPEIFFEPILFMEVSKRLNQGSNISKVLEYVPSYVDYGYGNYLLKSLLSSFVPRIIWPEKPKTGGAYNITHFLNDNSSVDAQNSYNLGLIGEGYAHFGYGAFVYLFLVGLLMKRVYNYLLVLLYKFPSLILWYPIIFISFLVIETDLLSFTNSLIKLSISLFIIIFVSKKFLNIHF